MDVCTRLTDTVALASLLMCILRMLYRLRTRNQRWRIYTPMLIRENRWRAMRYSFDEGLIDLAKGAIVPFDELLDELLSLVAEDAEALGCVDEVNSLHHILQRGTSAHRQLKKYELERAGGASEEEALRCVVDRLIDGDTKTSWSVRRRGDFGFPQQLLHLLRFLAGSAGQGFDATSRVNGPCTFGKPLSRIHARIPRCALVKSLAYQSRLGIACAK